MNDYVAWLHNGKGGIKTSVARGSMKAVEAKAREVYASASWQEFSKDCNVLTITRGAKQYFAKSIVL